MRDWIADWNKWSRAERVLALFVTFVLLALPLGILCAAEAFAKGAGHGGALAGIRTHL